MEHVSRPKANSRMELYIQNQE
jgi:hypothetical protein